MTHSWQQVKLGSLITLEYGKGLPASKRSGGNFPVYGSNGIVGYHYEACVKRGIVVGRKGSIGKTEYVDTDFWPIDTTYFIIDDQKYCLKWIYYLLQTLKLSSLNRATGVPGLNRDDVYNIFVFYPKLKTQERIALILTSIDDAIQKTDQIIQKTEKLKQGLIQKLFKHKNKVFLDTVANRGSGHTPNKQHQEYWNGGIKWVSLADSRKLDNRYIYETDKEISPKGIENSSAVLHKKNTVVVCRDAAIGRVAILGSDNMAVSQHFIAWHCSENLNFLYLYYWLQSQKNILEQIATGTTIRTIGLGFFRGLQIPLPSIQEQRKIGDIFWSIDENILTNQNLKAELILLKQGLMQDIFSQKVPMN